MSMRDQMKGQGGGDYAPSWRPSEKGDECGGIVVRTDENSDKWGNTYPIFTLRRINGPDDAEILSNEEVSVHMASTALRKWADEQDPAIAEGDWIAVRFDGKVMGKNDREFYAYTKGLIRAADVPAHLKVTGPAAVAAEDESGW